MKWMARLRVFLVAASMAGALTLLSTVPAAAGGCGNSCKPWSPPAPAQNGLQTILLIDAGGVVVLGVLLLLVVLYLRKRRSRLGKAE